MRDFAVMTGDIVRSQSLARADLDAIFAQLKAVATDLGQATGQAALFTRIRGDSWQAVFAPPCALRALFLMRAAVRSCGKGFETRIGVGLGPGEVKDSLGSADGPGFVASGHALDTMRKSRRIAGGKLPAALAATLPLAEALSARWTQRQAEVARYALQQPSPTRDSVAEALSVTQQTLQKHWSAAALDEISEACETFETPPHENSTKRL